MIDFEEPEAKYDFDPPRKRGIATRIRIMTFFIIFLMLILMLAMNGYKMDVFETRFFNLSLVCDQQYQYIPGESREIVIRNAENILNLNLEQFNKYRGFKGGSVDFLGARSEIPKIRLEFEQLTSLSRKIPGTVCGYKIEVVYR